MSKYFQNIWIFIFLIRKTSFIHTCTSSYVLLPSSPKSPWMEYMLWVRCCVGVSLESSVIWCLSDISTSRLSWPDCTVGTPVSSCHRAVKWNMLTVIGSLWNMYGIPKQPAITKLQYLLLLLHFRSSVQVHKYRSRRWILSGQKEWILTPFSLGIKKPTPARESRPGVMSQSSGLC